MLFLCRLFFVTLMLLSQSLLCVDFHDFDPYQYHFTAEQINLKIKTFLELNPAIKKFYRLTPQSFYIGDLEKQQIDYVLQLNTGLPKPSNKQKNIDLKNARIAIDPGHFGGQYAIIEDRYIQIPAEKTKNNKSIHFNEGDLTYLTALKLQQLLETEGASTLITRRGIGQGAIEEDFFVWLLANLEYEKNNTSLSEIFCRYNKEDLIARSKKINAFSPDITIVIHYNVHLSDRENEMNTYLTQSNYNLAFIPGAFGANELNESEDRYEFMRLIVTEDINQSLTLSKEILSKFVDVLNVPIISQNEKTSYTNSVCLIQEPGIYCRNLALTRLIHGPICYGETLIQNNEIEVYRLSTMDTSIEGISCTQRIEEVAQAYFKGINNYFSKSQTFSF